MRLRTAILVCAMALGACDSERVNGDVPDGDVADGVVDGGEQPPLPTNVVLSSVVDGNGAELVRDVAVDAQGNVYVAGGTQSTNFPTTSGAYQTSYHGGGSQVGSFGDMEVFVLKISPDGQVLWATLLGGPNYDRAYAIEVDTAGAVYIGGRAGQGFPTTSGALQTVFAGDNFVNSAYGPQDGFIAKLSADGSTLLWSTYVGDAGRGLVRDIDIDASGAVYAAFSNVGNLGSLVSSDAHQLTLAGNTDCALVKISADGGQRVYGTYLGGSGTSLSHNPSVRVVPSGDVFVLFSDDSTNVPTTPGVMQPTSGGGNDLVLAKFLPTMQLAFLTYVGGSGDEGVETHSLAVTASGEPIVSAGTGSTNFPTTPGTLQPAQPNGGQHSAAMIARISADGTQLLASTYFGGAGGGTATEGVSVDTAGNVYVSGPTAATGLPTTADAMATTRKGSRDGFVAILAADLSQLRYGSYLGGNGDDQIRTSALGPTGIWAVGGHAETTAGFPLVDAFQSTITGNDTTAFKTNGGFVAVFK